MNELLEKLSSDFDEDEGEIRIMTAEWLAEDLRLKMSICLDESSDVEQWDIICSGVVESHLREGYVGGIWLPESAPQLKTYHETEVALYFSENECEPELLLGVVLSSCVEAMGSPGVISEFLNSKATTKGIVSSRYGLLGRFPESIARLIQDSLAGKAIKISANSIGLPKTFNGSEHVTFDELTVLRLGSSYVIAESFSAIRT